MAAAVPQIAAIGIGLLASKFMKPKVDNSPIAAPVLPPSPDENEQRRAAAEAAQSAAALSRASSKSAASIPSTLLTGPSGLTTPAPVQRKTLLGQ